MYLGSEDWDAPRKLSDMYGEVDERLRPFLQDFNANVLVPREIDAFSKFRTGLRQVFEVLNVAGDREAMEQVFRSDKMFQALDNETVHAINEFAGTKIPVNKKGKVTDVCKAWEDQKKEGRAEGRAEGREKEIYESVRDGDYGVARGAQKLGISEKEFCLRMEKAGYRIPETV